MRKFTDEELKLAPAVAEVMGLGLEIECPFQWRNYVRIALEVRDNYIVAIDAEYAIDEAHRIPLEHDCLEWLSDNAWFVHGIQQRDHDTDGGWEVFVTEALENGLYVWDSDVTDHCKLGMGDTLLEALYRVIVACGENETRGE